MTKKKIKELNLCRYCKRDISHLHHNAVHCRSPICQEQFDFDRIEKVRDQSRRWRRTRKEKHKQNLSKQKCQACGHLLPKNKWFFCDDFCRQMKTGGCRIDGDWLFA